jgi:hypothetical protein
LYVDAKAKFTASLPEIGANRAFPAAFGFSEAGEAAPARRLFGPNSDISLKFSRHSLVDGSGKLTALRVKLTAPTHWPPMSPWHPRNSETFGRFVLGLPPLNQSVRGGLTKSPLYFVHQIMSYFRSNTACALCLYFVISPFLALIWRLKADRLKAGGHRPGDGY